MKRINIEKNLKYAFIIIVLAVLYFIGALRPIEGFVSSVINPILGGFYSFSTDIRGKHDQKKDIDNIIEENETLKEERVALIENIARLETAEEENRILRDHLLFLTKNDYRYIMSNIISQGEAGVINERVETILIDKGTKDGLYPGYPVASSKGIIIGKIIESKDNVSKIYLSNNSKCKLAATILGEDKTSGLTEGEFGLTIKMSFIPQSKKIKVGDIVVTSGLEENIPRGLVIGSIIEVNKESNELWQEAIIEPTSEPQDLSIVSVIIP